MKFSRKFPLKNIKIFATPRAAMGGGPHFSHRGGILAIPPLHTSDLPNPKLRSKKWVSTIIVEDILREDILLYASAEYFVNNLISPVFFYDKFKCFPSDAIVLEIGPHGMFRRIVSETLESSSYITLIKKDSIETRIKTTF